jgi:hypothetical protein
MCVRLDLLAESGWRRLEVGSWFDGVVQVKTKVPSAYNTVSTAGVSTLMSTRVIRAVVVGMLVGGGGGIQYGVVGIDSQAVDA